VPFADPWQRAMVDLARAGALACVILFLLGTWLHHSTGRTHTLVDWAFIAVYLGFVARWCQVLVQYTTERIDG
jgi:hypothetical protein